jgi:8-oxo-dGTP diphosphatase
MSNPHEVHFEGQVAVKVVIACAGKVLLVRGLGQNEPYDLPGGHLHVGELPSTAIVREVQEELGIAITVGDIFYSNQFFHPGPQKQTLMLVYQAEIENSDVVMDGSELTEVVWVTEAECRELVLYPVYRDTLTRYFEKGLG